MMSPSFAMKNPLLLSAVRVFLALSVALCAFALARAAQMPVGKVDTARRSDWKRPQRGRVRALSAVTSSNVVDISVENAGVQPT